MSSPVDQEENDKEPCNTPDNAHPTVVAYLKVFLEKPESDVEEITYPIMEGETTIGRGEDCDLVICAHSLSRQHAQILVEEGSHFIQDLASRNKTLRKLTTLRPKMYYELTDGCDLTFANVTCQYSINAPTTSEEAAGLDAEETQAYTLDVDETISKEELENNKKKDNNEAESDSSTVDGGVEVHEAVDMESTQAYDVTTLVNEQTGFKDDGFTPMDCDPTIAYDLNSGCEQLKSGSDEENESSSLPLLNGTPRILQHILTEDVNTTQVDATSSVEKPCQGRVCFESPNHPKDKSTPPGDDDDETDIDTENETENDGGGGTCPGLERADTEYMETDLPTAAGNVDPTVPYELEIGEKCKENHTADIEPTVPYQFDGEKSDCADLDGDSDKEGVREVDNVTSKVVAVVDSQQALPLAASKQQELKTLPAPDSKSENTFPLDSTIVIEPTIPYVVASDSVDHHGGPFTNCDASRTKTKSHSVVSLMEFSEQARSPPSVARVDTVLLESYDEGYEQTAENGTDVSLERNTTVLLESYQSTFFNAVPVNEGGHLVSERDSAVAFENNKSFSDDEEHSAEKSKTIAVHNEPSHQKGVQSELKTNTGATGDSDDDILSLIPDTTFLKQKTIFLSTVDESNKKGRVKKASRGRGLKNAKNGRVEATATSTREDTVILREPEDVGSNKHLSTPRLLVLDSVVSMEVDKIGCETTTKEDAVPLRELEDEHNTNTNSVSEEPATQTSLRQSVRGRKASRRGGARKVKIEVPNVKEADSVTHLLARDESTCSMSVVLSDDLLEESPDLPADTHGQRGRDSSEHISSPSTPSSEPASVNSSQSRRGKRGRGRGKSAGTLRREKVSSHKQAASSSRVDQSPLSPPHHVGGRDDGGKPRVMFTGLLDKTGEKTVRELGGELVDSVYQCTHLVTDKVRRTVKFLCCLSQGCLIVNDSWLGQSAQAGSFLPAESFFIKDRGAERQYNFSVRRSHDTAKLTKVLQGYKVYLTPSIMPRREQMADIIKCSGGDSLDFLSPVPLGEKTVIVTCDDDLSMCREAAEAGVPVCSTEFILGGVLKQELDLNSHLVSIPNQESGNGGRKRRMKEHSTAPAVKRRKK